MDLHRRIRTLRLRRGLTGMELARRAGVSPSYVSLIEHGEKTPSEEVAVKIARALGEREDLYRVWAATARMNEATRQAVWRMRGAERDLQRFSRADDSGAATPDEGGAREAAPGRASRLFADAYRPPGRPRVGEPFEPAVSYDLVDDERAPTLRIPLLAPGTAPTADPAPPEDVESLVSLDARILDRASAAGLCAVRVDEVNGRDAVSWLRPRDLVVVERRPRAFDPGLLHAFRMPEGLRFARASLAPKLLLILPDPSGSGSPRSVPLEQDDSLPRLFFGTVLWSGRLWRA